MPFWNNASPKQKRIYSTAFVFILAVLTVLVGSLVPLSPEAANMISENLNQTLAENQARGTLTQFIFLNNFSICLLMFVPLLGPVFGFYVLFNTGVALGAIASTQGFPISIAFLSLVITPVFWLEFIAYSLAMTMSIWLFWRLIHGRWREIKYTAIAIGICAGLLIVGAVVEVWIIELAGAFI